MTIQQIIHTTFPEITTNITVLSAKFDFQRHDFPLSHKLMGLTLSKLNVPSQYFFQTHDALKLVHLSNNLRLQNVYLPLSGDHQKEMLLELHHIQPYEALFLYLLTIRICYSSLLFQFELFRNRI